MVNVTSDLAVTSAEGASIRRTRLTVVCPCFNEEEVIEPFFHALCDALQSIGRIRYRILFVDDGSTDATATIVGRLVDAHPEVALLSLARNFGHQSALSAGLDFAQGDAVVLMDSDLQHPPALLPQMVAKWREGFDIVSTVRDHTSDAGFGKRATSGGFYWLFNRLSDTYLMPGCADFCLLSRAVYRQLRQMPERHRVLRGMVSWLGFRRAFVHFEAPPRAAGVSKYSAAKMIGLALDAAFSFSTAPLRIATRVGAAITAVGGSYLFYILASYFTAGVLVRGWGSLMAVVLVLGGIQLITAGLIGEYVARVFDEVKQRPLYVVRECRRSRQGRASSFRSREQSDAGRLWPKAPLYTSRRNP